MSSNDSVQSDERDDADGPLGVLSGGGDEELSRDEVFDVLSSARRRFVLSYLAWEGGEPVELSTLADEIAARENDTSVSELTSQQRKRLYVSLYQTHVPKLADLGIVEYDSETGFVSLTDRAVEIGRYLPTDDRYVGWEWYYLLLAAASTAFFLGVVNDVAVLSAFSEVLAAAAVFVSFLALALLHRLYLQRAKMRALGNLVDRERQP